MCTQCPPRPEEGGGPLGLQAAGMWVMGTEPGPLEEQAVLLTTGPSLQSWFLPLFSSLMEEESWTPLRVPVPRDGDNHTREDDPISASCDKT